MLKGWRVGNEKVKEASRLTQYQEYQRTAMNLVHCAHFNSFGEFWALEGGNHTSIEVLTTSHGWSM
jgi:hypothetical protein